MKNNTNIDALEKAVDFIGQYDGNFHDFHDELLVFRAFIHQYKQEIHIAVETDKNYNQAINEILKIGESDA